MHTDPVLEMCRTAQALITDSHIVYTSGRHGSMYFDKDMIYPHTESVSRMCLYLADHFMNTEVEVIVAPAYGGIILSQWVAYHLSRGYGTDVRSFYAEKTLDGGFELKRGGVNDFIPGKRTLVVEDVLTTGGSVRKVVEVVRELGGYVVGVGALCNRGDVGKGDIGGVPRLEALLNLSMDSWEEAKCPLCERNIPINISVGKGREFLARKQKL